MSSRLDPILDAVVTRVAARGFAVGGVVLPVYKAKATQRNRTLDPDRFITVAKAEQPEETTRRRFALWQTRYGIDVVVLTPHTGPETDQDVYAEMRDAIVDDFKRGQIVGANAFDWDAQAASWLRPYGDGASQWDWFACRLYATVAHA